MPIAYESGLDAREQTRMERMRELEGLLPIIRRREGEGYSSEDIAAMERELFDLRGQHNTWLQTLTPEERAKYEAQLSPGEFGTVQKRHPQGTAEFYDDSYLALLDVLRKYKGGEEAGVPAAYEEILSRFKGAPSDLEEFLQNAAPFIASSLAGTTAFKDIQDLGYDDPMQAYGQGLSRITSGAHAGRDTALRMLSASGLGRSSARAAVANQATQAAGAAGADLYTNLFQRRNEVRRAAASRAFDAHRLVATLALGHNPVPRAEPPPDNTKAAAIGAVGGVLGSVLGGPIGGAIVGTGAKKVTENQQ